MTKAPETNYFLNMTNYTINRNFSFDNALFFELYRNNRVLDFENPEHAKKLISENYYNYFDKNWLKSYFEQLNNTNIIDRKKILQTEFDNVEAKTIYSLHFEKTTDAYGEFIEGIIFNN